MRTFGFVALLILLVALAIVCFGVAVLAGADAEGRGGNYIIGGLVGALAFLLGAVGLALYWAFS